MHFSILAAMHSMIVIWGLSIHLSSFINEVGFSSQYMATVFI